MEQLIVSPSKLICFRECPELFKYRYIDKLDEKSDAMEFGTLVHMFVLEPEKFETKYARLPEATEGNDLSLNELKAKAKELGLTVSGTKSELIGRIRTIGTLETQLDEISEAISTQGKVVISPKVMFKLEAIKAKLLSNEKFAKILDSASCEVPVRFIDEKTDILVKGVCDGINLNFDRPIIFDLKITSDWKPKWFDRSNFESGRHLQAAAYCRAIKESTGLEPSFMFVAIEPNAPFRVRYYQADEGMLDAGNTELDFYLNEYKQRLETNDWSPRGDDNKIQTTTLTSWDWERIKEVI